MLFALIPMAFAVCFLVIAIGGQVPFLYGVAAFYALISILMGRAAYQSYGKREPAQSHLDRFRRRWL